MNGVRSEPLHVGGFAFPGHSTAPEIALHFRHECLKSLGLREKRRDVELLAGERVPELGHGGFSESHPVRRGSRTNGYSQRMASSARPLRLSVPATACWSWGLAHLRAPSIPNFSASSRAVRGYAHRPLPERLPPRLLVELREGHQPGRLAVECGWSSHSSGNRAQAPGESR